MRERVRTYRYQMEEQKKLCSVLERCTGEEEEGGSGKLNKANKRKRKLED